MNYIAIDLKTLAELTGEQVPQDWLDMGAEYLQVPVYGELTYDETDPTSKPYKVPVIGDIRQFKLTGEDELGYWEYDFNPYTDIGYVRTHEQIIIAYIDSHRDDIV